MTARSPRQKHNPRQAPRAEPNLQFPRVRKDAAYRAAKALLTAALGWGIRCGASDDGTELIIVTPARVPRAVCRWFEHELAIRRPEVVQVILQENGRGS
jgi:hypothetical protein